LKAIHLILWCPQMVGRGWL